MTKKDSDEYILERCFKVLNLDRRASKKEVELAYDVLTKDKSSKNMLEDYRVAFEWLMLNVFNTQDDTGFNDINKEKYYTEDEQYANVLEGLPEPVKEGVDFVEESLGSISDKAKAIFCTQTVNLPMFFDSIFKNKSKFLWFNFWTEKDITNVIAEACLNPIEYTDTTFELTYNRTISSNKHQDLLDFVENLCSFSIPNKKLCKKFEIKKTQYGVTGFFIAEEMWAKKLKNMLIVKANQCGCYLNLDCLLPKKG